MKTNSSTDEKAENAPLAKNEPTPEKCTTNKKLKLISAERLATRAAMFNFLMINHSLK